MVCQPCVVSPFACQHRCVYLRLLVFINLYQSYSSICQCRQQLSSYECSSMNARVFFWSLTSALAGFLFGFDTVVISGAEKTIQSLWGLSPGWHGIAMASALYGTVVGSLLGGWPADRLGRKATLLWIGVLYFVGAVGSALATNVAMFIAARVIGGLGIGISTVVAPMYISEIAPPKHRGRLAGMFQFNIVFR